MEIYVFLKSLTMEERAELAKEIETTVPYLNFLSSAKTGLSIKLAGHIYDSEFNVTRPKGLEVAEEDYVNFRKDKIAARERAQLRAKQK